MNQHNYYVYILTNPGQTVLYVGVTNNLQQRLFEHYFNRGNNASFAGKFHCYNLLYYERHQYIDKAIMRETQIKKWGRQKKLDLIKTENAELRVLNEDVCIQWPPPDSILSRGV
jgi:putative endonuclease